MMNIAVIEGRLTADPEQKQTPSGKLVCNIRIAVQRTPYKKTAENPEADFINVTAWGNTSSFVSKYFKKGQLIQVTGKICSRKWQGMDGKSHDLTYILAASVSFAPTNNRPQTEDNTDFDNPFYSNVQAASMPDNLSDFEEVGEEDFPL